MDVPPDSVLFHAYHKGNLAVGLKPHQAIDDMAAGFLKHLSPVDVIFLIKPCLQFHQYGYLFAVVSCLSQRCNDWGIAADTVKGLFDCQHLRVPGRTAHKVYHRVKALVWVVEQDIPFPDVGEYIIFIHQGRYGLGNVSGCLKQIKTFQSIHFHKEGQIQRTIDPEYILAVDGKLLPKDF